MLFCATARPRHTQRRPLLAYGVRVCLANEPANAHRWLRGRVDARRPLLLLISPECKLARRGQDLFPDRHGEALQLTAPPFPLSMRLPPRGLSSTCSKGITRLNAFFSIRLGPVESLVGACSLIRALAPLTSRPNPFFKRRLAIAKDDGRQAKKLGDHVPLTS